jgi:hypothetical protein
MPFVAWSKLSGRTSATPRALTSSVLRANPKGALVSTRTNHDFRAVEQAEKSPRNVRKVGHSTADIEALAASIAANGIV